MIMKDFVRRASVRRRRLVMATALTAALAGFGITGAALAKKPAPPTKEPTGEFAVFKQCPRFTEGVENCLYNTVIGGEITYDKLTIPVANPITFQFGFGGASKTGITAFAPLNGELLSSTPEPVPGGLSSLIDCDEFQSRWLARTLRELCRRTFQHTRFQNVNAITELVGSAGELYLNTEHELFEEGVGLRLPVKVRLENPLLGDHCYIGSNAEPVVYEFTTGTTSPPPPNKPISGQEGSLEFSPYGLLTQKEHITVDNAFSVPVARGCGGFFSYPVDRMIDNKVGLPSPAGHNTIIFDTTGFGASVRAVTKSEE